MANKSKREEFIASLKTDTRSKEEIFEAICDDMRGYFIEAGNPQPTDYEVQEAARNLIGYCECLLKPDVAKAK